MPVFFFPRYVKIKGLLMLIITIKEQEREMHVCIGIYQQHNYT